MKGLATIDLALVAAATVLMLVALSAEDYPRAIFWLLIARLALKDLRRIP